MQLFLKFFRKPLLTKDQLRLLKYDNISGKYKQLILACYAHYFEKGKKILLYVERGW